MAELNFKKLADAPILEEVPDGAKVYAEVEGKVYRVAGDNLGGGVKTAIFYYPEDSADGNYYTTCQNMTFEEAKAMILAREPIIIMGYYTPPGGCNMFGNMFIDENRIVFFWPGSGNNYWYPDGTITNDGDYTPNLS